MENPGPSGHRQSQSQSSISDSVFVLEQHCLPWFLLFHLQRSTFNPQFKLSLIVFLLLIFLPITLVPLLFLLTGLTVGLQNRSTPVLDNMLPCIPPHGNKPIECHLIARSFKLPTSGSISKDGPLLFGDNTRERCHRVALTCNPSTLQNGLSRLCHLAFSSGGHAETTNVSHQNKGVVSLQQRASG